MLNEGEINGVPSKITCLYIGPNQVRPRISEQSRWAIYFEAETRQARLRWLSLNGDEFFIRFAGRGFSQLFVYEIEQANDNRNRRPCCHHICAHHVWGGRLSGRAELCFKGAAMGNQTVSAKIRVTVIFIFTMTTVLRKIHTESVLKELNNVMVQFNQAARIELNVDDA